MSSTTAGQVAAELRKLADALDKEPEASVPRAFVNLCPSFIEGAEAAKLQFLNLARLLPRPVAKKYTADTIELMCDKGAIYVWTNVSRNSVCRVVRPAQPAEYDCVPLLSEAEEAALEANRE